MSDSSAMELSAQGGPPLQAGIGCAAPDFTISFTDAAGSTGVISLPDYAGKWLALIFYPRDFSFVCPTELTSFSARQRDFRERNCELLGVSIDTLESHQRWLTKPASDGGVGGLRFPLGSDPDGAMCRAYGLWVEEMQLPHRGLFLIDPGGKIQFSVVHGLSVGRSVDEVLRVLDALQSGGICPASWTAADGTIDVRALLTSGRVLGHYRIERELGEGAFGNVFAAWDLTLERMVAVKVLRDNEVDSRELLLSEARAAAAINHANVCTVYAVEQIDGLPVIVMEYLEGRPLGEFAAGGVDLVTAGRLVGGIAEGLDAAHQLEVTHGDLKPANVIVVEGERPVVVDFGLNRLRGPAANSRAVTRPTAGKARLDVEATIDFVDPSGESTIDEPAAGISGTPAYMSPEQALGKVPSPASDVFSLGLIAIELLTGTRALDGDSVARIVHDLQRRELAERLTSRLDGDYRELVRRMLYSAWQERPTAADVVRMLARIG